MQCISIHCKNYKTCAHSDINNTEADTVTEFDKYGSGTISVIIDPAGNKHNIAEHKAMCEKYSMYTPVNEVEVSSPTITATTSTSTTTFSPMYTTTTAPYFTTSTYYATSANTGVSYKDEILSDVKEECEKVDKHVDQLEEDIEYFNERRKEYEGYIEVLETKVKNLEDDKNLLDNNIHVLLVQLNAQKELLQKVIAKLTDGKGEYFL